MSFPTKLNESGGSDAALAEKHSVMEQQWSDTDEPSDAEIRRIVRKIDWRLIPMAGFMVAISLLDRANLSNANIAG